MATQSTHPQEIELMVRELARMLGQSEKRALVAGIVARFGINLVDILLLSRQAASAHARDLERQLQTPQPPLAPLDLAPSPEAVARIRTRYEQERRKLEALAS